MRRIFIGLVAGLLVQNCLAEIVGQEVTYKLGDDEFKGYIAFDDANKAKRPGVLVVHEWWGHNDYARKRARMLAELGYVAFALDMYGEGKLASHPQDAGKMSSEVMSNQSNMLARFDAALKELKHNPFTDNSNIAAIGYCFGGAVVLQAARAGENVKGVVSFHGSLATQTPAQKGKTKAAVLVLHGADDKFIKPEHITAIKDEMKSAAVDFKFIEYPGAVHAFTNPDATGYGEKFGIPLAYNKSADEASWQEMQTFFNKIFK